MWTNTTNAYNTTIWTNTTNAYNTPILTNITQNIILRRGNPYNLFPKILTNIPDKLSTFTQFGVPITMSNVGGKLTALPLAPLFPASCVLYRYSVNNALTKTRGGN